MTIYLGYACALLIGLILGLMGGGGSILTVPVLVYLLGINPVTATAYSLFIVGSTSAVGTFGNYSKGIVDLKTGLVFALPSLIGTYLSRKFLIPAIPDIVFSTNAFQLTKDGLLMLLFGIVIFAVALSMLRKSNVAQAPISNKKHNLILIVSQLLLAGMLVGMVGAGGGFLFIPFLIYVAKMPVKKAVATSLLMISVNSLVGFIGSIGTIPLDWQFLLVFSLFSIIGIFFGIYLNKFIKEQQLKKGFAWFVMLMAVFILTEEILF
jgi:uncharacterized membrane protein YfcA